MSVVLTAARGRPAPVHMGVARPCVPHPLPSLDLTPSVSLPPSLTLPRDGGGDLSRKTVKPGLTYQGPESARCRRAFPPPLRGRAREGAGTGQAGPGATARPVHLILTPPGTPAVGDQMTGFHNDAQKAEARRLRHEMTEAQKRLWQCLRAHRFMGLSVRRQAPVGPLIVDFLIPAHRLAIETGHPRDPARAACLKARGYRVLGFTDTDILTRTDAVLRAIAEALRS